MKGFWLGQAGFLFETENGTTIMIDPYFSDSVERLEGPGTKRLFPADESFLKTPDVLIISHKHADHMDFDTIDRLIGEKRMTMLLPAGALAPMRERYAGKADFMLFTPGTEITLYGCLFRAVPAAHSDFDAVGIIINADGKTVYHTGDTLYRRDIFAHIDEPVDLLVTVINGKGNNMNAVDAARFTKRIDPKAVLPMHWDMFPAYAADVKEFTALFADRNIRMCLPEHFTQFEI